MNKLKITSINVRVDDDLKDRVARLAAVQGVTISELVRGWFLECVELEEDALEQELREFEKIGE